MIIFNRVSIDWPMPSGEQIKARLRSAILSGEIGPGTGLPKIRALAAEVGVNANTVAAAYRDLVREGLIATRKRGGTRVAPGPFLPNAGDLEVRKASDRLISTAQLYGWSGADVIRLVAGRWSTEPRPPGHGDAAAASIYDFLRNRDYDEG
jgi:GntR family transcriptional regulator